MFLTPPSPSRTKLYAKLSNETSPASQPAVSRQYHPAPTSYTNNLPPLQASTTGEMATSHRGLDHGLPPGTILPDPMRGPPQLRQSSHDPTHGPPQHRASTSYDRDEYPPQQWQQQQQQPQTRQADHLRNEDSRSRQEEDKRRQEELKLRQEEVKLEQRRLEQEMLRESIAKGIHPNLVPLIFLGLGAAGSGSTGGFEMAQQYIQQFQQVGLQVQNQLSYGSPDPRRDYHAAPAPTLQYGALQQSTQASVPPPGAHTAAAVAAVYPSPAYQSPKSHARSLASQSTRFGPTSSPAKLPPSSALPRLTTNEAQVQAGAPGNTSSSHGPQPGPSDHASPSTSIYFHHWQPPANTASSSQKTSPKYPSNLSSTETHHASPRKRKATGPHQPSQPPASRSGVQRSVSPSQSTTSTSDKRHGRRRSSDVSMTAQTRVSSRLPSTEAEKIDAHGRRGYDLQTESQQPSQPTSSEMTQDSDVQRDHPPSGDQAADGRES